MQLEMTACITQQQKLGTYPQLHTNFLAVTSPDMRAI